MKVVQLTVYVILCLRYTRNKKYWNSIIDKNYCAAL